MIPSLLLFDFDGVLVDSFDCFYRCFNDVCQDLNFPALVGHEAFLRLFDTNLFTSMAGAGLTPDEVQAVLVALNARLNRAGRAYEFFPGAEAILRRLAAAHLVYIITSNLSGVVEQYLDCHGLLCGSNRPEAAGVREVLGSEKEISKTRKIAQVTARHPGLPYYYIGDTCGDIHEGRLAGARTVGAAWGWHGLQRLGAAQPDYLLHTPEDLATLFLSEDERTVALNNPRK